MKKTKASIREANFSDRDKIIGLFNSLRLPYQRDREYWVWLNRIVTSDKSIVCIAEYEGNIIAHYAIVPIDMNVQGVKFRGALGVNAVVHPDFRDKVQMYRVTSFAYKLARQRQIDFMYAFPNKYYWEIQTKIEGCTLLKTLPSYVLQSVKLRDNSKYSLTEVGSTFQDYFEIDNLSDFYNQTNKIGVHKNLSYYINRYINHPQNLYQCFFIRDINNVTIGFVVFKTYTDPYTNLKHGHLIDFVRSESIDDKTLIDISLNYFAEKNIDKVIFWPINTDFRNTLELTEYKAGFLSFPCIKVFNKEMNSEIVDFISNIDNWNLFMGDSDAF